MDMIEKVARAWASIDGKIDAFEREREGMDYDDPAYTGHYEGYMAEAKELLKRSGVADLIERQNRIIEHLVELFVDTTTVENPERELVVIEARALIAPEEGE